LHVKGPKGQMSTPFHSSVTLQVDDGVATLAWADGKMLLPVQCVPY